VSRRAGRSPTCRQGARSAGRLGSKRIAELEAAGLPVPQSQWTPTGVRKVLRRETYRGEVI
jgi:hypothetical protein